MDPGLEAMVSDAQRLMRLKLVPEAIAAHQRLLRRWPTHANSWFNLGVLFRGIRRLDEALACYQKAVDLGASNPEEVYLNRAVIYSDYLRQDVAAERELHLALAANPGYLPAMLNLANIFEDRGRRDEALAQYQRMLQLDPQCAAALARYANMQGAAACDQQLLARLRSALARPRLGAAEQADLGFALGRALDASGAYEDAFSAYATANRMSQASAGSEVARYNSREQEQFIDRLIGANARQMSRPAVAPRPRPIFICGMFRSGSTLIEQLLANCQGVAAGGELDLLPAWTAGELAPYPESLASMATADFERLARHYLESVSRLFPDASSVLDKRPDNFLNVGLIKSLFPDAKIVHTTRDPLDNCLSIYFLHLDERMSYATDLMSIGHYYRQYRRLMDHWRGSYGDDIVDLHYDDFVQNPQQSAERLFAALGLSWNPEYLQRPQVERSIKTASVWQVREPFYRHSSGRSSHYERQLAPLREYLADLLPH